jgi:hypothetical protein
MLIKGYINRLCGERRIDLRMGVPAPTTKFAGMSVTPTETQRKASVNVPYQSGQDARKSEAWSEMQPRRFLCRASIPTRTTVLCGLRRSSPALRTIGDSTVRHGQLFHTRSTLWLHRFVRRLCMLSNIIDDDITDMLLLAQGSRTYATYTQQFTTF